MLNMLKRLRKLFFKKKKGHEYVVLITTPQNAEKPMTKIFEFKNAKKANACVEHMYRHMQRINMRDCNVSVKTKEL